MLIIGCDFHTSYQQFSSGNMTNDGLNTMVGACPERSRRDAENHVTSATSGSGTGTYTYDGSGQRVKKIGGGNTIVTIFAGAQVLAEYYNGAAPSSPTDEYIYAGSMKIASIQSGTTNYWHNDHLSPRVRTDTSGNVSDQRATFPFGETWYSPGASPYMFTSYYRDYEASGNDYAQARYNVSGLGRFSSPDPISGSTSDPQSLNRYSYVRNMPVMLTDPFGTCPGGTAQNRDSNQSPDQATNGSGPYASDSPDSSDPNPQQGPPPWNSCKGFTDQGGGSGGGTTVDGVNLTGVAGLAGSSESNVTCPNGDCALANQGLVVPTAHGNIQFWWAGTGWENSNGNLLSDEAAEEWGLPDLQPSAADLGMTLGGPGSGPGGLFSHGRQLAQTVLDAKNDCSKFFNSMLFPSMGGDFGVPMTAGDFLRTDNIAYDYGMPGQPQLPRNSGAGALGGAGAGATIWIAPNSVYDLKTDDSVGGFASGYPGAQAEIILHELAHTLLGIPSDGNDPLQSWANSQAIDDNCYSAILSMLRGK